MAFKIFTFVCKVCALEQDQMVSNAKGKAEEVCKQCGSEPKQLKRVISIGKHGKHVSWSKWQV